MKLEMLRAFALGLPEVTEEPHHTMSSFRVRGTIFVTMPPDGGHVHVFPSAVDCDLFLALYPQACERLYWGGKAVGVRVHLASARASAVKQIVQSAYEYKACPPHRSRAGPAVPSGAPVRSRGTSRVRRSRKPTPGADR